MKAKIIWEAKCSRCGAGLLYPEKHKICPACDCEFETPENLELTRNDLIYEAKEIPIEDIKYYHIKGGLDFYKKAHKVVFIDEDGKTKTLKDRNSKTIL